MATVIRKLGFIAHPKERAWSANPRAKSHRGTVTPHPRSSLALIRSTPALSVLCVSCLCGSLRRGSGPYGTTDACRRRRSHNTCSTPRTISMLPAISSAKPSRSRRNSRVSVTAATEATRGSGSSSASSPKMSCSPRWVMVRSPSKTLTCPCTITYRLSPASPFCEDDFPRLDLALLQDGGDVGQDLLRGLREHRHRLQADHLLDGQHRHSSGCGFVGPGHASRRAARTPSSRTRGRTRAARPPRAPARRAWSPAAGTRRRGARRGPLVTGPP